MNILPSYSRHSNNLWGRQLVKESGYLIPFLKILTKRQKEAVDASFPNCSHSFPSISRYLARSSPPDQTTEGTRLQSRVLVLDDNCRWCWCYLKTIRHSVSCRACYHRTSFVPQSLCTGPAASSRAFNKPSRNFKVPYWGFLLVESTYQKLSRSLLTLCY